MRRIVALLAVLLAFACAASRPASPGNPSSVGSAPTGEQDGTSFEKAIVITETSEMVGIQAEYRWIHQHFPGSIVTEQGLVHRGNRSYDILTVSTREGEREVYFDITAFYGKF